MRTWIIRAALLLSCGIVLFAVESSATSDWDRHFRQGEALQRQGEYTAALAEFEAALPAAERIGPNDWMLPVTLHNLGAVCRELGRYDDAERFYRRAIGIFEANQPQRRAELAGSLHELGTLNLMLGRLSQAESWYRKAYELRLAALGKTHALTGASLQALARVAQERHQFEKAEDLYRQAAGILESANGPGSLVVADVLHNWGMLYRAERRDPDARPLLERAATIYQAAAPAHPKLAIIWRNLAELEAASGNLARAADLFQRSVQLCETSLPPDHPQTGVILQAYAGFLYHAKRKQEAAVVAARARSILANNPRAADGFTVDAAALRR